MAERGVLQLLEGLEARLIKRVPRCAFYFGEEELDRARSGPSVVWMIRRGTAMSDTRERSETDRLLLWDDMVEITARCLGSGRLTAAERSPRRAEYEASVAVFCALSACVAGAHQGYYEDVGWELVTPLQPADAGCPIDYTFRVRVQRREIPWIEVQPTEAPATVQLEQ